ncbi:hypothetical protein QQS21_006773 [Conoideocrella luteorostrata]|uniref:Uncharacterized protein n=1 Tax=Conoideocrella luteorostrata TaxID=1105319 RepID=A0AAJ0FXZ1_9HYPO|nr:hypothetical protein QQS21_006773 [Conoideocrella luteorostrata]
MHRCHGSSTDINAEGTRAVTKLKATITERFEVDGAEFDIEADCRFCFYFEKDGDRWVSTVDDERLKAYPSGYRYLAYWQEATMGVKVLMDMPGHRRHEGTKNLEKHDELYWKAKKWLEGEAIEI